MRSGSPCSSLAHSKCLPRSLRTLANAMSELRGPIANGEKFVVLDEEYLAKFDEIVVIGDVHGCNDEFVKLLNKIHQESPSQNPDKCLKILVGDLVNKGPKSKNVLEVCRDKFPDSILAVRGNHDEIALDQYKKYKSGTKLLPKNKWIQDLPSRYVSYLENLPFTISIPSLNCIIVHGGLDPSLEEPAKTTPTNLMTIMRNIVVIKNKETGKTQYKCTKSAEEGIAWATFWPGPEHVYFGHDARRRLQNEHEFATGLDTGCVYGDRLTGVYIKGSRKGELVSINALKVYEATSAEK